MLDVIDIYNYCLRHNSDTKTVLDMLDELCHDKITVSDNSVGSSMMDLGLVNETDKICKKMCDDCFLIQVKSEIFVGNNRYIGIEARGGKSKEALANHTYDCKYLGFPYTRQLYLSSVRPIAGINKKDKPDIGTVFKVASNVYATARHCVIDMKQFNVYDENNNPIHIKEIIVSNNGNIDIALLVTEVPVDGNVFQLDEPHVLEDILVMGYPPISGMLPFLVCEKGQMSATMKSTIGANVGETKDYLRGLECFLISARVKGGSSGSPVVNEYGNACGIVVSLPSDTDYPERIDLMGYGACLPSNYIEAMLKGEDVKRLTLNCNTDGYYVSN